MKRLKNNEAPSRFRNDPKLGEAHQLFVLRLFARKHPNGRNQATIPVKNMEEKLLRIASGVKRMLRKPCARL